MRAAPTRQRKATDITIFDPERIHDAATYEEPLRKSEGVRFVLVNGVAVVRNGQVVRGSSPVAPRGPRDRTKGRNHPSHLSHIPCHSVQVWAHRARRSVNCSHENILECRTRQADRSRPPGSPPWRHARSTAM